MLKLAVIVSHRTAVLYLCGLTIYLSAVIVPCRYGHNIKQVMWIRLDA